MRIPSLNIRFLIGCAIIISSGLIFCSSVFGQTVPIPSFNLQVGQSTEPGQVASTLQVIVLLTVLTLAPAILIMTTSFTRIIIVLSFMRNALGTQQSPPNQVLLGFAMFLTFFIMAKPWSQAYEQGVKPYLDQRISQEAAIDRTISPIKKWMEVQTREKDLALFVRIAKIKRPRNPSDVPWWVVVPAFVISELKTAFQMGFIIYIPFLVIDMVVSAVLMSMGMMMLPPIMISLPFKIMLFVLVDGWYLITASLVRSFPG
ncbi:MAG: flagellar type III secretion system pore protein FliP [Proteobacteria bacterium]|nr:flagellar type III secretion system pore protein FliP [Pseudomonadota bacterium]